VTDYGVVISLELGSKGGTARVGKFRVLREQAGIWGGPKWKITRTELECQGGGFYSPCLLLRLCHL
jgi:hypothetical protein